MTQKELPSNHLAVRGKELLVDPWTQRCTTLRGPCLVDHVVHVVEHMEVGVLPEMIRWPFSWVPGLGEIIFSGMEESSIAMHWRIM